MRPEIGPPRSQDGAPKLHPAAPPRDWTFEGAASSPSKSAEVMQNIDMGFYRARVHAI
jgi:hypothetical protein